VFEKRVAHRSQDQPHQAGLATGPDHHEPGVRRRIDQGSGGVSIDGTELDCDAGLVQTKVIDQRLSRRLLSCGGANLDNVQGSANKSRLTRAEPSCGVAGAGAVEADQDGCIFSRCKGDVADLADDDEGGMAGSCEFDRCRTDQTRDQAAAAVAADHDELRRSWNARVPEPANR
jgi:hypothetical protein